MPPLPRWQRITEYIYCEMLGWTLQIFKALQVNFRKMMVDNSPSQLLNATFKDEAIDDRQILKYQPSVTSRVIFHHLIPLMVIK